MIAARAAWRVPTPLWRRGQPPGFIRPCEPMLVDRPPTGPGWLHEVKHDGWRILALKHGDRVQLWTRHGTDFANRFARIAAAVRGLAADEALIDGEAVVHMEDGRSDFHALLTKRGEAQASFVAFDLLRFEGDDLRLRPIEERRSALLRLVSGVDGIVFNETLGAEGAMVFAKACELGLEGIVSKRADSLYRSGRSRSWLKTKNPNFVRT